MFKTNNGKGLQNLDSYVDNAGEKITIIMDTNLSNTKYKEKNRNMKIAITLPELHSDSAIKTAEFETIKELKKKHEVTLLKYGRFSVRSPFSILKTIVQLTSGIAKENCDILHINSAYDRKAILRDYLFLKVLRKRFSNAVFLKFHGTDSNVYRNHFFKVLTRQFLTYVDGIGFLSNDELIDFQQNFKRTTNFSVIKNSTPSIRNIRKGDNRRFNALFVGRIMASKGICDVVEAFIDIDQDNIRLNVLGNGALYDRLSRSIRNPRIKFHGYLPETEVLEFYRDCDVLVLPTYHQEGLPNVILKALSFGKPIITTKVRGMKDYLTDKNCIFVAPHSPNEIKSAIGKLYQDPKLRERMSFSNLQLSAIFEPSVVATEYETIYRSLIK